MTAGRGIAHSEEAPQTNSGTLNGVQLWVALPGAQCDIAPAFDHYDTLPVLEFAGGGVNVERTLPGQRVSRRGRYSLSSRSHSFTSVQTQMPLY
jgi:redox-sensitive bicupin YhaK (pirin superfamily)